MKHNTSDGVNNKNMHATEQELKWAVAIKEAAKDDPDIHTDVLSDLEYLQHAIVAKNCVDAALCRIKRLAAFKERYGIQRDGSLEEGLRDLAAFSSAHPGVLLAVTALTDEQHLVCFSLAKFCMRNLRTSESLAITMRGFYYVLQACHYNIAAMRVGLICVMDGKQFGWKNFNFRVEEHVTSLFAKVYPVRVNQVVMLNANLALRVFFSVFKLFLPKKMVQRHILYPDRDSYFQQQSMTTTNPITKNALPVEWDGMVDAAPVQQSIRQKLQARYDLVAKFKL